MRLAIPRRQPRRTSGVGEWRRVWLKVLLGIDRCLSREGLLLGREGNLGVIELLGRFETGDPRRSIPARVRRRSRGWNRGFHTGHHHL